MGGSAFNEHEKRPDHCIALSGKSIRSIIDTEYVSTRKPVAVARRGSRDIKYRLHRLKCQLTGFEVAGVKQKPPRQLIKSAGYADLFAGYCGVVVRPEFFNDQVFDIPKVIWSVDDIWLSGMLAYNNVPIWLPQDLYRPLTSRAEGVSSLRDNIFDGADRETADQIAINYLRKNFDIWK